MEWFIRFAEYMKELEIMVKIIEERKKNVKENT